MNRQRLIRIAIVSVPALILAAALAWVMVQLERRQAEGGAGRGQPVMVAAGVEVGGPFTLIDHRGTSVTEASYAGRFRLMYFGYTYCPDFCPTELQVFAQVMDALGPQSTKVQPILVTIDPARDTPDHLAGYVALFHPTLVGLTGTPEQVAAIAKAYRVYYAKAPGNAGDADYLMDHSTYIYLMDGNGKFVSLFRHGTSASDIAATIQSAMKAAE